MEINKCMGVCTGKTSTYSRALLALFKRRLIRRDELPCCRPLTLDSQSVITIRRNGRIAQKMLNIRVSQCACRWFWNMVFFSYLFLDLSNSLYSKGRSQGFLYKRVTGQKPLRSPHLKTQSGFLMANGKRSSNNPQTFCLSTWLFSQNYSTQELGAERLRLFSLEDHARQYWIFDNWHMHYAPAFSSIHISPEKNGRETHLYR